ncbi:hypothetical protein Taro_053379 [Colocasia esculenta]|uniref:Uncharacterized protein n=1 Tax=Colocasia esculenta TaxID=4460 RepID=A0A843XMG7_COLES|nr:hypothetical protein [Colocasia esculenta]
MLGAHLPRFEFERAGARVQTICIVPLVVSSVNSDPWVAVQGLGAWRVPGIRFLGRYPCDMSLVIMA